jgi:hypothetical protein
LVKKWVYEVAAEYPYKLTIRTIFYRLRMTRGFPAEAYKWLVRWMKRWREEDPWLYEKIFDPSRRPQIPRPPIITHVEVWSEKYLPQLQDLFEKYRVTVLYTRGYASISCLRDSLRRAKRRGVTEILYFGDLSPTGLDIERVTRMRMPIKIRKIALTWSQVRRYHLPPRPCKPKDRRTPRYIAKYGNQAYDLEALDPKILREITERELRKLVPVERLRELERWEEVERAALKLVRELRQLGLAPEEVMRRLERLRKRR